MKIVLERRSDNCFGPASEAHFGWHFLGKDIAPVDRTIEVELGKKECTFPIHKKGIAEKVPVVHETNWDEVSGSWLQAPGR